MSTKNKIGHRQDCGCTLGAIFFLAAALLYTFYVFKRDHFGLHTLPLGVGIALSCAMVGKMIGIGIARIKHSKIHV